MNHESQLLDLIVQWEERRAAGETISPEELCRDCPGLLEELKGCVRAVAGMNEVLKADGVAGDDCAERTRVHPGPLRNPGIATPEPWPIIPHFEILEELGRGGMGIVFKARQVALGRLVTVKTILTRGSVREEQRRRFAQEAKAMALLQHPNIVQIHEVGQQGEAPYLVMEYVEGESLAESLAGKPLPPSKAAELVAVLARAIHAAHEHGIIHRDLKPNNILLKTDGTPKICDFGLAKHFESVADQTQTFQPVGTPSYMAPEQVQGHCTPQGPAVDIYALGAVLYEMLSGRPPHLAASALDTMQLVVKQEPIPPSQWQPKTPRDLETICLKCLAKEPRRRYASAKELAEDLARFLADEPIHARPVGAWERSWRWCRAHPSRAALTGVAATAVAVVLTIVLGYNRLLSQELDRTDAARREVLKTQDRMHHTLTQEIAGRLNGDLRELAAVPVTTASLVANRRDWSEEQLEESLRDMLNKAPRIFGLSVAFEPREWRKDREDFALYVFRRERGLAVKQLLLPAYRPLYRQWQWYRIARNQPQGVWGEPYIGDGGDRTPMVTFSAPIQRDGRFVGVVTADLAMEYFRNLRDGVDGLDLGPGSYGMVVTSGQRILQHRFDRYEYPSPDSDLNTIPLDDSFRSLANQWAQSPAGSGRAMDFSTGQPATFLYCRVPAANWTLVLVVHTKTLERGPD